MDICRQHVAGVAVPKLMECDAPFLQELGHGAGHTPRLGRRAVCQGDDMPAIVYADTKLEQFFALLSAPTAQFLNC